MQSPELQQLIREHADHLDSDTSPVLFADLSGPRTEQPQRTTRPIPRISRALAYAAAAAALVVVLVGGAALLLSSDDPIDVVATTVPQSTVPTTIPEARGVFDLGTDSLCEWFTADEMNEIIALAQQRVGTDFPLEEFTADPSIARSDPCWGSGGPYPFQAWSSPGWLDDPTVRDSLLVAISYPNPADTYVNPDELTPDQFAEHALLDDGVTYHFLHYTVGYEAGLRIYLTVEGHDRILEFGLGVGDQGGVLHPTYSDLGFAVANELLHRMNWIE